MMGFHLVGSQGRQTWWFLSSVRCGRLVDSPEIYLIFLPTLERRGADRIDLAAHSSSRRHLLPCLLQNIPGASQEEHLESLPEGRLISKTNISNQVQRQRTERRVLALHKAKSEFGPQYPR